MRTFLLILSLVFIFCFDAQAAVQVPILRMKMGTFLTTVNGGSKVREEELGSLATIQPTVLWDLPSFRSRIGYHYLGDFDSQFGLTPITGLGFSGYFYPSGLSSAYEISENEVVQQKYRFAPYVYGGLTPVNLSINKDDPDNSNNNTSFSALILEVMLGVGIDYPFRQNLLLSLEFGYRFGSAPKDEKVDGNIDYSGMGVMVSFTTSYF